MILSKRIPRIQTDLINKEVLLVMRNVGKKVDFSRCILLASILARFNFSHCQLLFIQTRHKRCRAGCHLWPASTPSEMPCQLSWCLFVFCMLWMGGLGLVGFYIWELGEQEQSSRFGLWGRFPKLVQGIPNHSYRLQEVGHVWLRTSPVKCCRFGCLGEDAPCFAVGKKG